MKVTTFRIENPRYELIGDPTYGNQNAFYKVPTLPAYAIIDSRLDMENSIHIDAGYLPTRYELLNDCVVTPSGHQDIFGPISGILTVYHNGIKDYKLLFPHIEMIRLKCASVSLPMRPIMHLKANLGFLMFLWLEVF